jgi:hypothetical protein
VRAYGPETEGYFTKTAQRRHKCGKACDIEGNAA